MPLEAESSPDISAEQGIITTRRGQFDDSVRGYLLHWAVSALWAVKLAPFCSKLKIAEVISSFKGVTRNLPGSLGAGLRLETPPKSGGHLPMLPCSNQDYAPQIFDT
jgi:hypothetical protein